MKLFALALASVDAATVKCNNGDAVEMKATVAKTGVQADLSQLANWIEDNGNYVGTWTTFDDSEKTSAQRDINGETVRALVLTKKIDSGGCTKKTVDNVTVCTKTGHELSFECAYSLEDQDLDQTFTVSGSDIADSASGVGTLEYKMSIDKTGPTIGDRVTAPIKPTNGGLVTATLKNCSIKRDTDVTGVSIIDEWLKSECKLGANIITGQGDGDLSFSWTSFKWTTQKDTNGDDVVENQGVKCSIKLELTKDVTPITPVQCPSTPSEDWIPFPEGDGHQLFDCFISCGPQCSPYNESNSPEWCQNWCKDWDYPLITPNSNMCYCYSNHNGRDGRDCRYSAIHSIYSTYKWWRKADAYTKPNPNPSPPVPSIIPKGTLPPGSPGLNQG